MNKSIIGMTALGLLIASPLATGCAGESEKTGEDSAANTARTVCSPQQQVQAFQAMVKAPIIPPRSFGGIDFTVGNTWAGPTLDDAERTNCQSTPHDAGEEGIAGAGWGIGDTQIVQVQYDKATRKIDSFTLNPGYEGTLEFRSRAHALGDPSKPNPFGQHTYSIGLGRSVLRDGQPWTLNWKKPCTEGVTDCWDRQSTELFDGMMATFAPELSSTQTSCIKEASCLASSFATGSGVFGVRPLGMYVFVGDVNAAPSTPEFFYGFYVKQMPFSSGEMFLKLDDEGPIVTADKLGDRASRCVMKLGQPFTGFLGDCVQVMNDSGVNAGLRTKALGGAKQVVSSAGGVNRGTWVLDLAGARPNFGAERFDEREPSASSKATEIALDIRSSGKIKNELGADGTMNLAGTGAVLQEYARIVQAHLHSVMDPKLPRFPLGAPECLGAAPAAGCTGVEQIVLPATPAASDLPTVTPQIAGSLGIKTVLKPGDPRVVFCTDPGTFDNCGWDDAPNTGLNGSILDTKKQIVAILGGGSEDRIPEGARDPQVYASAFTQALVTYLRSAGGATGPISANDLKVSLANGFYTVKYQDKFELVMNAAAGSVTKMTFR